MLSLSITAKDLMRAVHLALCLQPPWQKLPNWLIVAPSTGWFFRHGTVNDGLKKTPHLPGGGEGGGLSQQLVNTPHHHKHFQHDFCWHRPNNRRANENSTWQETQLDEEKGANSATVFANTLFFLLSPLVRNHGRQAVPKKITPSSLGENGRRTETNDRLFRNNLLGFIPQPSRLLRCKTPYNTSLNHVCALY